MDSGLRRCRRSPSPTQTYGALNAAKSNAILICHALTGDQHVANPPGDRPGGMVGNHGRAGQADRHRPVFRHLRQCGRRLHGVDRTHFAQPGTGEPYGLDLPVVTIDDMVRAQAMLIDSLGIETLFCVAGGSMGGMQVLQWAAAYPDRVFTALPIATAARHSSQNIAFHEVGRQAIMADPDWRRGDISSRASGPARASPSRAWRRTSPISRRARCNGSSAATCRTGHRGLSRSTRISRSKSYLRHQGSIFVERFDPNSYLYMTRAMDYFDFAADYDGSLVKAFKDTRTRFCVASFTSDWLFPTKRFARHGSRAQCRRAHRCPSWRSRRIAATTRSARYPRTVRDDARLHRRRRARAGRRLNFAGSLAPPRVDLLRVAEWSREIARARRRLRRRRTAAPAGRDQSVDGRGIELSQHRASTIASPRDFR